MSSKFLNGLVILFSISLFVNTKLIFDKEGLVDQILPSLLAESRRFSWPVQKGVFPQLARISSTFGESRTDHFHAGVDVAGDKEEVHPVAGGKVLFYQFESMNPYRPMPGAGNQIWLDHGDGVWSGYYHLSESRLSKAYVETSNVIALTGHTGRSGGPHLHFIVTENYGQTYLNPMIDLLPKAVEHNAPIIEHLVFLTSNGVSRIKADSKEHSIRLSRNYPIYAELTDPGLESGSRRSPRLVEWKHEVNGQTTKSGRIEFLTLQLVDGVVRLNGESEFDQVYSDRFLRLGDPEFESGVNHITIIAEDHAGNRAEAVFILNVKREF